MRKINRKKTKKTTALVITTKAVINQYLKLY